MKLLPARKIYYGWYILVGVILAQFMATSTGQMVSGVFLDPLVEALQIEVWQFAAAISLATALGGISMVFIGPLVDRIGPRRLMLAGAMFSAIVWWGCPFSRPSYSSSCFRPSTGPWDRTSTEGRS